MSEPEAPYPHLWVPGVWLVGPTFRITITPPGARFGVWAADVHEFKAGLMWRIVNLTGRNVWDQMDDVEVTVESPDQTVRLGYDRKAGDFEIVS